MYGILLIPLGILLLAAAVPIRPDYLGPGQADFSLEMLACGLQVFMAFRGSGYFPVRGPQGGGKEDLWKGAPQERGDCGQRGFGHVPGLCWHLWGGGGKALPWPAVTLMSTVEIPGGFLQRWDVVFTGLLLTTFFIAVSAGLFYVRLMSEQLLPWRGRGIYLFPGALAVFLAACWCKSYETAARVYVVVNGYIMIPLAVGFTCLLALIEWNKKRRKS